MPFKNIEYILFDAANTIIHKPSLWISIQTVLKKYNYILPEEKLRLHHKLLSEVFSFPDRTSKEFYRNFNTELLMSFGIIPSDDILNDLFATCTYLPWERFSDSEWLNNYKQPIGVLSNFNNSLSDILKNLFGNIFSNIIVSESILLRKPDLIFYQHALDVIGLPANQILYVGDSLKLDIIPAKKLDFQVLLIDRLEVYCMSKEVLHNLSDIISHFNL